MNIWDLITYDNRFIKTPVTKILYYTFLEYQERALNVKTIWNSSDVLQKLFHF
jgi:hypothetical protein